MSRRGAPLLATHTALVYAYLYAPILILVLFSFNSSPQTAVWRGFTVDWYRVLWHDPEIQEATVNSLIVAGYTTVIATLLGTLAGVGLGRSRFRGRSATVLLLYLPLVIPEIVLGVAMLSFFGLLQVQLSMWTVIVAHVVFSVSYVAIVVRARMAGMDPRLEEAAADLGAPPAAVFWRVTLPLLLPAILAGGLLVLTISLDDYVITSFVAGVNCTTLPVRIYSRLKKGVTPEINAVSTLLLLFTVVPVLAAHMLLRRDAGKGDKP